MISTRVVIGFLLFSVTLLACLLMVDVMLEPSALRADTSSRAGRYIVTTASVEVDQDLLWVANVNLQQLIVFGTDKNGVVSPLASLDLLEIFERQPIRQLPSRRTTFPTP